MGNIFHPENKYIQFANRVVDMCAVGLLWLVLSVTVVLFGPATTAAYHTVVKVVRRERGSLLKEFWRAFKRDFVKSLVIGLILVFLMFAVYLTDFVYNAPFLATGENPDVLALVLMAIKVILLVGIGLYAFPILSRFNIGAKQVLWTSMLLMVRHFFSTCLAIVIVMVGITAVAIYPYLIVVVPGLCIFALSFLLEKIFQKYMRPEDKELDETKDQWYLS